MHHNSRRMASCDADHGKAFFSRSFGVGANFKVFRYDAPVAIGPDPFSDESLRKLDEWRRASFAKSSKVGSISGYVYRGMALALLYGAASIWGYQGVPEAVVTVAIISYYCGQAAAKSKRY